MIDDHRGGLYEQRHILFLTAVQLSNQLPVFSFSKITITRYHIVDFMFNFVKLVNGSI